MLGFSEFASQPSSGGFRVHYQPRFTAKNMMPETMEALLRCDAPTPIERIVERLEERGIIRDVTLFVLKTVCSDIKRLQAKSGYSPMVAINAPPSLFADQYFLSEARRIVEHSEVCPRMIEFEITESRYTHDIATVARSALGLQKDGFKIAIDDFGAGFSGFRYLDMIPVSAIKIDRHFISGLGVRPMCHAIIEGVSTLATKMNLVAVAEGVETQGQLEAVVDMGYAEIQGFLLAKPMCFTDIEMFLSKTAGAISFQDSEAPDRTPLIVSC